MHILCSLVLKLAKIWSQRRPARSARRAASGVQPRGGGEWRSSTSPSSRFVSYAFREPPIRNEFTNLIIFHIQNLTSSRFLQAPRFDGSSCFSNARLMFESVRDASRRGHRGLVSGRVASPRSPGVDPVARSPRNSFTFLGDETESWTCSSRILLPQHLRTYALF